MGSYSGSLKEDENSRYSYFYSTQSFTFIRCENFQINQKIKRKSKCINKNCINRQNVVTADVALFIQLKAPNQSSFIVAHESVYCIDRIDRCTRSLSDHLGIL